jgi:hypothetical protein
MRPVKALLLFLLGILPSFSAAAESRIGLRPPLWVDRDDRPIPQPSEQIVSELYAIVYNSWLRHLSLEYKAQCARDSGALNVNAWDEVPDSTWFTNRMGRQSLSFQQIVSGIEGRSPKAGPWTIIRIEDEGYTPKFRVQDAAGGTYILKFDLPSALERNSAAERICTLILHAAGYNVPHNSVVYFPAQDLRLNKDSYYRDAAARRRPMTPADLENGLGKLKTLPDGRYRGLASHLLPGKPLEKFLYTGTRKDDPNDLIPHELRRELRGLRVIASWINHVDVGDKNTQDMYVTASDGRGFVKHYLLDFGSTLGSGDFVNGPYRVGHEYIFDGPAMGRAFVTLGIWRRPWEVQGKIPPYPEIGYYQAELFEPHKWKPNYPNLAFERIDDADAYWGAKVVTAFSDEMIRKLAEAGEYSRAEVTAYLADVLKHRRDAIGRHWFDKITPLEEIVLDGGRLRFRDLGLERGYAEEGARSYRFWVEGVSQKQSFRGQSLELPNLPPRKVASPDRYGRTPLARLWIQSNRRAGGWALPVEVILGRNQNSASLGLLGWRHAVR